MIVGSHTQTFEYYGLLAIRLNHQPAQLESRPS